MKITLTSVLVDDQEKALDFWSTPITPSPTSWILSISRSPTTSK